MIATLLALLSMFSHPTGAHTASLRALPAPQLARPFAASTTRVMPAVARPFAA
jgi:hypothetical protein